jgi:nitrous oxide reductase accessory protein NosL
MLAMKMQAGEKRRRGSGAMIGALSLSVPALLLALAAAASSPCLAAEEAGPKPDGRDKCPVCGMFVAPYPDWTAAVVFSDGSSAFFDGPKDMFKYLFGISAYERGKGREDVERIFVTEYYTMRLLPAQSVTFVTGSSVLGPMGKELVPVEGEREVEEFLKDHGGRTLAFGQITPAEIP